jgi:thiol:disulfide interchange protein DsbD
LCLPFLLAQGNGHLTVGAIPKVSGKRSDAVEVKIPVSIDAGFHVNSDKPSEDYLIPLKVKWTDTGALQGGDLVYPKPTSLNMAGDDKPLSVFEGSFNIVAKFKVAGSAPAGPGSANGKLSYQACNAKMCFPPKTVDISVPYSVN